RGFLENRAGGRVRGDVERAVAHRAVEEPRDVFIRGEQAIDRREAVVHLMTEVVTGGRLRQPWTRGGVSQRAGRNLREVRQCHEWAVEAVENAIELDAHRVCERVTGRVVWRRWRPARVRDVVRMILRLEHVEDVRPESLRRLYDERVGRIALAVHRERGRRTMDRDT